MNKFRLDVMMASRKEFFNDSYIIHNEKSANDLAEYISNQLFIEGQVVLHSGPDSSIFGSVLI